MQINLTSRSRMALAGLLLLAPAAMLVQPAIAHHSYSMFDMNKTVVLDAKVLQFKWQNPHAFIQVEVPVAGSGGAGKVERWAIEMTSPNNLVQEGWKRTSLKTGDKVKLWVHPLRTGAKGGSYSGVKLTDGTTLGEVS